MVLPVALVLTWWEVELLKVIQFHREFCVHRARASVVRRYIPKAIECLFFNAQFSFASKKFYGKLLYAICCARCFEEHKSLRISVINVNRNTHNPRYIHMHTHIPIHTYIHTSRSISLGCFELEEIENSNSNGLNNKFLDTSYNKKFKISQLLRLYSQGSGAIFLQFS